MSRSRLDFYETPVWQTRALCRRLALRGSVLECCVGDGSLSNALKQWTPEPRIKVFTNDIDPARAADFHLDATKPELWTKQRGGWDLDWVVTNPPFNSAFEILQQAVPCARLGVILLLRLSFLEPTDQRGAWLAAHPPQRQFILPRWSYKGNGKADSVTTAWMIWSEHLPPGPPIEIVDKPEMKPDEPAEEALLC